MGNRVLIIGNVFFCNALIRAFANIDALKRTLVRFLYSKNVKDNLLASNLESINNVLTLQYDVRLIVACLDLPLIVLIRDIRIGKYGKSIAGVPIVVISAHSFSHSHSPLILHHIYQSGAYFAIPFNLDRIRTTLESLKSVSPEQLSRIRSEGSIFCDLIDSVAHSLTDENCKTSLNQIVSLAEGNFKSDLAAVQKLRDLLSDFQRIDKDTVLYIKNIFAELKEEVISNAR